MRIEYTLNENPPSKEALKSCHESFKAFRVLFIETANIANLRWPVKVALWFLLRFYRRTIENGKIIYDLYLLEGKNENNS